jgi:magnesium transporter
LFIAQTLTGNVLSFFQGTLSQVVALSFFIPLLIGTGGNIGSQTVTLVVRALAVGQVNLNDLTRIIWKESRTGVLLGLILGIVGFFWAQIFTGEAAIGATVAVSILVISLFAATVGALIPLLLHRVRLDPATASTPFISTVVDASGLLIYFAIARIFLGL